MSTYASQLRQQTGIILSSNSRQGGEHLADIFSMESSGEEIPFPEEHHQVEVAQPTDSGASMVQRQPEPEKEETRSELVSDSAARSLTDRSSGQETVSPTPKAPPDSLMPEQSDRVAPEAIPRSIVEQHEISTVADVSSPLSQQKQPRQNRERPRETTSPASLSESLETIQVESGTTQQAADAPLTAQTYLQVVRDWVAGTPVVREEVREVSVKEATPNQLSQNATQPIVREEILEVPVKEAKSNQLPQDRTNPIVPRNARSSPLMQEQVSHSPGQQPRVEQDFVLSIGSIHLTVTAPVPENEPAPIVPAQVAPTTDAEPFRLSRHYLRFR